MSDLNNVQGQLAKPFDETEIKWKPQVTTKGRNKEPIMRGNQQVAGCTAHIDARAVMNRLDDVVGVGGWSDSYRVLDGKHVECTLTVWGISKSDVGETNEGGFADSVKSAYSDALKRAAVKFGIGRHLYDMEMEWLPFDGYRIIEVQAPQKGGQKQQSPLNGNGRKAEPEDNDEKKILASASNFTRTAIVEVARYPTVEAVKGALKKLGYNSIPGDRDERLAAYRHLKAYASYRDAGMDSEAAVDAALNGVGE